MQIPVFALPDDEREAIGVVSSCLDPLAFECVPYRDWTEFGVAASQALC